MRHRSRVGFSWLIAGWIVTTATTGWSFSLSNHRKITEAAVAQIQACADAHGERWKQLQRLAVSKDLLVRCDLDQDKIVNKVKLWHFHGGGQKLRGSFFEGASLALDTSFDAYFQLLGDRLAEPAGTPARSYAIAGALLHYVQDVAVPAHVVPIYHPTPSPPFTDQFDDFAFQAPPLARDLDTCQRLLEQPADTLPSILDASVAATKAVLETELPTGGYVAVRSRPDAPEIPLTWSQLWDTRRDADGFGHYGCAKNHFGKPRLSCGPQQWKVPAQTYREFAAKQHRMAVEASVRTIMIAVRKGAVLTSPPAKLTCPVPCKGSAGTVAICDK